MYGYTDGTHDVFICFKCGRFDGISNDDPDFLERVTEAPVFILELIQDKILADKADGFSDGQEITVDGENQTPIIVDPKDIPKKKND